MRSIWELSYDSLKLNDAESKDSYILLTLSDDSLDKPVLFLSKVGMAEVAIVKRTEKEKGCYF